MHSKCIGTGNKGHFCKKRQYSKRARKAGPPKVGDVFTKEKKTIGMNLEVDGIGTN